jgi:hypothetical protein
LARLRLTSKAFDVAATPALFQEVKVGKKGQQSLRAVAESGHLKHTRKLTIEYAQECDDYHDIVRQMLRQTPRLESFAYVVEYRQLGEWSIQDVLVEKK